MIKITSQQVSSARASGGGVVVVAEEKRHAAQSKVEGRWSRVTSPSYTFICNSSSRHTFNHAHSEKCSKLLNLFGTRECAISSTANFLSTQYSVLTLSGFLA
jgi:hypothetical protein